MAGEYSDGEMDVETPALNGDGGKSPVVPSTTNANAVPKEVDEVLYSDVRVAVHESSP